VLEPVVFAVKVTAFELADALTGDVESELNALAKALAIVVLVLADP
jgi:hypothetical protein